MMTATTPASGPGATTEPSSGIRLSQTTLVSLARRFPLVRRRTAACGQLAERVEDVAQAAYTLSINPARTAERATYALNSAALLASDCKRPELAVDLCWRQVEIYTAQSAPLTVPAAMAMLGPVTNIARLRALSGQTDSAISLLTQLLRAVRTGGRTTIEGHVLRLDQVEGAVEDRRALVRWTWGRLLTDGIKALALVGRWSDAARLVTTYNGLGDRLTEPRQAMVLASLLDGDLPAARRHLTEATPGNLWEHEVGSCLAVLTTTPQARAEAARAMVDAFRRGSPQEGYVAHRARHGVTVALLARATENPHADDMVRQVADEAIGTLDGYAAREVLRHADWGLSEQDHGRLERIMERSGLTGGRLTGQMLTKLQNAADSAASTLGETLASGRL